MNDPVIQINGLSREFGDRRVLDSVELLLEHDSGIVALLGPNGAGKTTLLGTIAGLLEPTFGSVAIFGQSAFPPPRDTLAQIAVVLDGCEPPRWADVYDLLNLRAGADAGFDRKRAIEMIRNRGLKPTERWQTLSKGQKRYVLATLAVFSSAKLLLLDEPADGLDPEARSELYALLREQANERSVTILLASHILSDVERIADRVVILQDGQLQLDESLETLREEVAEVELAFALADSQSDFELLGRKPTADGEVVWVRHRSQAAQSREWSLPGERARRGAGLESIYRAVISKDDHVGIVPETAGPQ